jgi:hypothetical protein
MYYSPWPLGVLVIATMTLSLIHLEAISEDCFTGPAENYWHRRAVLDASVEFSGPGRGPVKHQAACDRDRIEVANGLFSAAVEDVGEAHARSQWASCLRLRRPSDVLDLRACLPEFWDHVTERDFGLAT